MKLNISTLFYEIHVIFTGARFMLVRRMGGCQTVLLYSSLERVWVSSVWERVWRCYEVGLGHGLGRVAFTYFVTPDQKL